MKCEKYEDVVYHVRVRLRFALLRSTLLAVRGKRGKTLKGLDSIEDTSFNLIPENYKRDYT